MKMSLIWSSPSNSNMNSNKDCYNQPTVKKFENYRLMDYYIQPTVKKFENLRLKTTTINQL